VRPDTLPSAAHTPPLDIGVRVVVKLGLALRAIRPLVRVSVRNRLALELGRYRGASRRHVRAAQAGGKSFGSAARSPALPLRAIT
jgi:hypothetical protein